MNPSRTRWVIVAVGLLAIAIAVWAIPGDPEPIEIRYAFTTDAADLLVPLIDEFNESGETSGRTPGARRAGEQRRDLVGRDTERRIENGTLEPEIWTPASSLWAGLLAANFGDPSAPRAALARPVAPGRRDVPRALQHAPVDRESRSADARPELQDVLDLAADPAFKFAHTDPNQSTSGLSVVLSEFQLPGGVERERVDSRRRRRRERSGGRVRAVGRPLRGHRTGLRGVVVRRVRIRVRRCRVHAGDHLPRARPQSEVPGPVRRALPARRSARGRLPVRDPRGNLGQVGQRNGTTRRDGLWHLARGTPRRGLWAHQEVGAAAR